MITQAMIIQGMYTDVKSCVRVNGQYSLAVPRGSLQFVIVVFPDHTHYFWDSYLYALDTIFLKTRSEVKVFVCFV